MQTLFTKIQKYISDHYLITHGNKIVIAFSGGPDSMLLLHFLAAIRETHNLSLIAAHLDHGWRETSASEALFCKEVCDILKIPFFSTRLTDLALPSKKLKGSKEEIGRNARRFFLEQIGTQEQADSIALGQHFDDQEETFFIRLIRGSTISGLTCMKVKEGLYIRPLLSITKKEILAYLDAHTILYITDPSNEHDTYLRNRIRKYVLPALHQADNRFDHNFLRTLTSLQQTEDYLKSHTEKLFHDIAYQDNNGWLLQTQSLLLLEPYMQNRLLLVWLIKNDVPFTPTERFLNEILRFINQPGSKQHTMHKQWSIVKKKNTLEIKKQ